MRECRITDFLPEHQIAVADRYGLIIMLHLSMREAVADNRNIEDLLWLCDKYGQVKWILAHGAGSYAAWPIEKAAARLKKIPNLWYEVSLLCEMEALDALFSKVGVKRVMCGADSPVRHLAVESTSPTEWRGQFSCQRINEKRRGMTIV